MNIFHVVSEYTPYSKVGGLADAVKGLTKELAQHQNSVSVCLPLYKETTLSYSNKFQLEEEVSFQWNGSLHTTEVYSLKKDQLTLYFFKPIGVDYFERHIIYGHADDPIRFIFFCQAVHRFLQRHPIDILHIHDWTSGLLALLHKKASKNNHKVVLTIHNAEHQGNFAFKSVSDMETLNLLKPYIAQDKKSVNLLRIAIENADFITTVSPSYRNDLLTEFFSFELYDILQPKKNVFKGILNGIDYNDWNPKIDPFIPIHFDETDFKSILEDSFPSKKTSNKLKLLQNLHMPLARRPLVVAVTRLAPQKGLDLIQHALYRTLEQGGMFILLGSSQDPAIHEQFSKLSLKFQNHPKARIIVEFDEQLAHQLYAAADISIIPSIYEPCGLTQLISLRYGTIPVVRKTGGLDDSINDIDYSTQDYLERNGFVFNNPDFMGVDSALDRALKLWFDDCQKWNDIVSRCMTKDMSWHTPALEYLNIYKQLYLRTANTSHQT